MDFLSAVGYHCFGAPSLRQQPPSPHGITVRLPWPPKRLLVGKLDNQSRGKPPALQGPQMGLFQLFGRMPMDIDPSSSWGPRLARGPDLAKQRQAYWEKLERASLR